MKNKILAILLILTLLLSGCSEIKLKMEQIENYESEESICQRYSYEVLDYLESGDKDGLKSMFSEDVRNMDDFDEEIDELFDIWGDYTIENRETLDIVCNGRERAWDYGEWTRDTIVFSVATLYIEGVDSMGICVCLADADEENIGVQRITLWDDSENEVIFAVN